MDVTTGSLDWAVKYSASPVVSIADDYRRTVGFNVFDNARKSMSMWKLSESFIRRSVADGLTNRVILIERCVSHMKKQMCFSTMSEHIFLRLRNTLER